MSHDGSASPRPLPALLAVAATAAGVFAMFGAAFLGPRLGLGVRGQIALGTVLLAVPALAVLAARRGAWPAALGPGVLTGRVATLATLLGAALWVGSIGLMEMQSLVAPPPERYLEAFRALHDALKPDGPLDMLVSLAVIAVLPGLCEELVVRGVLLPSLLPSLGPARAVGVSALLFAGMHGDPYRFLFTLTIGLLLGALRLRTGSLWPPILAHVTLNALTFAIAPLVDDPTQPYSPQPLLGLACLAAGAAVAVPLLRALSPGKDESA
jgi:membrane protease YdiL (CAAX protease family)